MPFRFSALLFLLFTLTAQAASLQDLRWVDASSKLKGKDVALVLGDGSRLQGRALRVEGNTLVVQASSGERAIPKSEIREIEARGRGKGWRTLFLAWGALTALGGSVEGGPAAIGAGAGIAGGGYVLGDYLDKRSRRYRLVD
jgi:hypothetical protein